MRLLFEKISTTLFIAALLSSVLVGACMPYILRLLNEFISTHRIADPYFLIKLISAALCYGLFYLLSTYFISKLAQQIVFRLRMDLSTKILYAAYEDIEPSLKDLLPILTADINTIALALRRLPNVVSSSATTIGCLIYMIFLSWKLASLCIIIFILIFLINYLWLPHLKSISLQCRNTLDNIYTQFDGIISGIKELNLNKNHRGFYLSKRLKQDCQLETQQRIRQDIIFAMPARLSQIVFIVSIGLLVYYFDHFSWMSPAAFSGFLLILLFMLSPLSVVMTYIKNFKEMQVSLEKIMHIGIYEKRSANQTPSASKTSVEPCDNDRLISLEKVSFDYDSGSEIKPFSVGPLNINIKKNEIIFLIGGNGSGKTTFIKLLCGLYRPTAGKIKLRGELVNQSANQLYREMFGGVFTDYYLFSNIRYLDDANIPKRTENLLKKVKLNHKVTLEKGVFSTTDLSYGEKKRLALVISILEDRDIYIYDEWAANQDPQFREIFYTDILPGLKANGKTVITITHDDQYFQYADRIFEMRDGAVSILDVADFQVKKIGLG